MTNEVTSPWPIRTYCAAVTSNNLRAARQPGGCLAHHWATRWTGRLGYQTRVMVVHGAGEGALRHPDVDAGRGLVADHAALQAAPRWGPRHI